MDFQHKIHEEILQTVERRAQILMKKIFFISLIFGAGAVGKIDAPAQITLFGALYLAPFVTLAIDCFVLRETWSLRRISQFLRCEGNSDDKKFEEFVKDKRNPFYPYGMIVFSLIIIIVSAWMLWYQKSTLDNDSGWNVNDWIWIVFSFFAWVILHGGGRFIIWWEFERGGCPTTGGKKPWRLLIFSCTTGEEKTEKRNKENSGDSLSN